MHLARRIERGGYALSTWKTLQNHTTMWKINDLRLLAIQERGGIPRVQPGPEKPLTGASQGEGCALRRVRRSWAILRSLVGL